MTTSFISSPPNKDSNFLCLFKVFNSNCNMVKILKIKIVAFRSLHFYSYHSNRHCYCARSGIIPNLLRKCKLCPYSAITRFRLVQTKSCTNCVALNCSANRLFHGYFPYYSPSYNPRFFAIITFIISLVPANIEVIGISRYRLAMSYSSM